MSSLSMIFSAIFMARGASLRASSAIGLSLWGGHRDCRSDPSPIYEPARVGQPRRTTPHFQTTMRKSFALM